MTRKETLDTRDKLIAEFVSLLPQTLITPIDKICQVELDSDWTGDITIEELHKRECEYAWRIARILWKLKHIEQALAKGEEWCGE